MNRRSVRVSAAVAGMAASEATLNRRRRRRQHEVVLLAGPSSVGKSTLARTEYAETHEVIDTDVVWANLQKALGDDWWKMNRDQRMGATLAKSAMLASQSTKPSVIVHPDPKDFASVPKMRVVFVFASLGQICENVRRRGDRNPKGVLVEIKKMVKRCKATDAHAIEVFRDDMACWKSLNSTKALKAQIDVADRHLFVGKEARAFVCPRFPVDEVRFLTGGNGK